MDEAAPARRQTFHGPPAAMPPCRRPPCNDCERFKCSLDSALVELGEWNKYYDFITPVLENAADVGKHLDRRMRFTNFQIKKLKTEMASKNKEFTDTISEKEDEISSLKESLQITCEEADNIEHFWKEECIRMTARWQAEKVILLAASQLKEEMLQIKNTADKQSDAPVEKRCKLFRENEKKEETPKEIEEKKEEKCEEKEEKKEEMLQNQSTADNQSNAPVEKRWRLFMKKGKKGKTPKEKEEKKEEKRKEKEEKTEKKRKEKEEKKEKKRKEKEEKKEKKREEKEEKKEKKREEKEEKMETKKRFWSWMHKDKKCDNNSTETVGCSVQM